VEAWDQWYESGGKSKLELVSRKYGFDRESRNDLLQELLVATLKACRIYNVTDEPLMNTVIKRAVVDWLRRRVTLMSRFTDLEQVPEPMFESDPAFDFDKLLDHCVRTGNIVAKKFVETVLKTNSCDWGKLYEQLGETRYSRDKAFAEIRKLGSEEFFGV
jgi:hypothetical protein